MPVAVQTVGAPLLTIVPAAPGQATISWTPATPGFVLQETLSLAPSNWVNSASGALNPVPVPATVPGKFYRLSKPFLQAMNEIVFDLTGPDTRVFRIE